MNGDIRPAGHEIIVDGECFSGASVPDGLVGREKETRSVAGALAPMLRGRPALNIWLHGPPGSGKTSIARQAVGRICPAGGPRVGAHVNCWQHRKLYGVLQAIVEQWKILGAEAQDTQVKLDRIRQHLRGRPAVIILDEIDRPMPAQREEVIRGLLELPRVGLACIARDTRALAGMDGHTRSRLCPAIVTMPAYSTEELLAILTDRAERGLAAGTWTPRLLQRIADAANGDARVAIETLGRAAAASEQAGCTRIGGALVERFLRQAQAIRLEARAAALSEHEKLIQQLISRHGPMQTAELAGLYAAHCRRSGVQPMAGRTLAKYIARLEGCGLLSVSGWRGRPGGRTVRAA